MLYRRLIYLYVYRIDRPTFYADQYIYKIECPTLKKCTMGYTAWLRDSCKKMYS